ncbi:MAG: Hsp20/alpha crystallin family protein [Phycisphaerae bacterium]|jgi:HSP20 family protein
MNLIPWRSAKREGGSEGGELATFPRLRREIDGLFERFFRDPFGYPLDFWTGGTLRTDLAESDDEVMVRVELPGVEPGDLEVKVAGNTLTISGEKKMEKEDKRRDYHYVERRFGSFHRSIDLPGCVDPDKVEAGFKNGVLTVTIAKRPEAKPRRIKVSGN